jgi:hypothetical protein
MSVRFVVRGEKTSGLVNHAEGGRPETGPAACGVNPQAWTDSRGVRHDRADEEHGAGDVHADCR